MQQYKNSVDLNFRTARRKGVNIINYGKLNDLPEVIIEHVNNSAIASTCIEKKSLFVEGNGFTDETLNERIFCKKSGITGRDLLKFTAQDLETFEGFYWRIQYNNKFQVIEIDHLPFECCRLGEPDEYGRINKMYYLDIWNPQKGQRSKMKEPIEFNVFNPAPEVVQEEYQACEKENKPYPGQFILVAKKRPGARFYPVPRFMGGDWVGVDGEISKFHYSNLLSGFTASAIMTFIGDFEGKDEDGRDKKDALIEEVKTLVGSENAGTVMVRFAKSKDQVPEVTSVPSTANHEMFITLQNLTTESICILFQVPPIIAGVQVSGKLGNTQEIINSLELFQNNIIKPDQNLIIQALLKVGNYMYQPITEAQIQNIKPINQIPDKLIDSLTTDEKRELAGYKNYKEVATLNDKIKILDDKVKDRFIESLDESEVRGLAGLKLMDEDDNVKETLNGNQITSLVDIAMKVKSTELTPESAVEITKVAFGITRKRAEKILGVQLTLPLNDTVSK